MAYGGVIGPGYATYPALGATLGAAATFAIPNTTVATTPGAGVIAPVAPFGAYPSLYLPAVNPYGAYW